MITLSSLIGNTVPFWGNIWFWLFIFVLILAAVLLIICMRRISKGTEEQNLIQQQHTAKMDKLREDHAKQIG